MNAYILPKERNNKGNETILGCCSSGKFLNESNSSPGRAAEKLRGYSGGSESEGPCGASSQEAPPPQPCLGATPVPLSHLHLAAEQLVYAEQVGVIAFVVVVVQ